MTHDRATGQPMPDLSLTDARLPDSGDLMRLDGQITDVNVTGSDPTLQVRGPDGCNWTIELADRATNARLGLTRAALLPGDKIGLVGHRLPPFAEQRIKALTLTVEGRLFDLAPEPACA